MRRLLTAGFGLALLSATPAAAAERAALVIGNGAYRQLPGLANATADADLLAATLERHGFTVSRAVDVDRAGLDTSIAAFDRTARDAEVALVYYAGHGVQIDGVNYLVPIDAGNESQRVLAERAMPLSVLLRGLDELRAGVTIIVLDACRDDPLPPASAFDPSGTDGARALLPDEGLARVAARHSMMIAYATAPNQVALDGPAGRNGPYARALADVLGEPQREVRLLFGEVSDRVRRATGGLQVPWTEAALGGEPVFLTEPESVVAALAPEPSPQEEPEPQLASGVISLVATLGTGPVAIDVAGLPWPVTVAAEPKRGRVLTLAGRGLDPSTGAAPGRLAYEPEAVASEGEDRFVLRAGATGKAQEVPVTARLEVDPCDRLAGARFDAQGAVLGRFPNEIEPAEAIPACRAAVERFPQVARFRYQLGAALELSGDAAQAATHYAAASAAGHHLATTALAVLHLRGVGVVKDVAKARAMLETAAAQDEPRAMSELGKLWRDGTGMPADRGQAMDWFLKAAAHGHSFAYNNLGAMLLDDGRAGDAAVLFRAGTEVKDIWSYNNLGFLMARGNGVARDVPAAIGWYEKAAAEGQPMAPVNLGLLYRDGGPGLAADPQRAAGWFAEAARRGNAAGDLHLAALHRGTRLGRPDPALAAMLLARAAGSADAVIAQEAEQALSTLPRRAVITAVQRTLSDRGIKPGAADGALGPATRAAVAELADRHRVVLDPEQPPERLLSRIMALPAPAP